MRRQGLERTILAWPLAALLAAGCAPAPKGDADAKAAAVADRVMQGLGGRGRWAALAGLRWTFQAVIGDSARPGRRHAWDKHTGWHRVDGVDRLGRPYVMIEKLDAPEQGMAWVAGQRIEGDSLARLITRAKSLWTNDTYWMLMPYKLRDPGVHLAYDGEVREGDVVYDKLALSFDQVGETPGDRYWIYVNRANDRIEKWDYVLEGEAPPPETWTWEGWQEHDGLWFPTAHRRDSTVIHTRDVETMPRFPSGTFEKP